VPPTLDAPRILAIGFCLPTDDEMCRVAVLHSDVDGAVRYVMVTAAGVERDCSEQIPNLCVVQFSSAPGCGVTLRAVDRAGHRGDRSESFCVRERVDS
jgi:hypothetical protein